MATDFLTRLQSEILIMYVPMQTLLVDWGKDMESHLSEWVLSNPEKYQEALIKSYEVGCDMGHTATQASSIFRSTPFGLQDKVYEFNYQSAKLAKEVTPEDRCVAGNISASNPDFMEPYGSYTYDFVYEGYKEQIMALAEGGVDVLHISGNHIDALCVAVKVAKDLTNLPIISHNVYFTGKKGFRTMMGKDPKTASTMVAEAGADVVGCICGLFSYEDTPELIRQMREGTDNLLGAQPDAGLPDLVDGETVYPASPDKMADAAPGWVEAGARLVGGCCGTTLEHYTKLSAVAREIGSNKS